MVGGADDWSAAGAAGVAEMSARVIADVVHQTTRMGLRGIVVVPPDKWQA
jgi:hypothetical protein